jgi:hypothetical protein
MTPRYTVQRRGPDRFRIIGPNGRGTSEYRTAAQAEEGARRSNAASRAGMGTESAADRKLLGMAPLAGRSLRGT